MITFTGFVTDLHTVLISSGAVIPGARVVAVQSDTGVERSATTDSEGRFQIAVGEPGNYRLKVMANGFNEQESETLVTNSGHRYELDMTLAPAGFRERSS